MYTIATLHDLRRHLQLEETDSATDADLQQALQKASHLIETLTGRRFCPFQETLNVSVSPNNAREMMLPDDLLELISASGAGGALDIKPLLRVPNNPDLPASVLVLREGEGFDLGIRRDGAVSITGVWGWHDRWTRAWRDSGDSIRGASLTAAASSFSVTDTDGSDEDGNSPRFQIGQLLRIKDEYLRLTGIDRASNRLRAQRGVNGTEAAAHAQDAPVEVYCAPPAIRDLCLRYAELLISTAGFLDEEHPALVRSLRRLTA